MTPRSWLPGRARALAFAVALASTAVRATADAPGTAPAEGTDAGAAPAVDASTPSANAADSPFIDEIVVTGRRPRGSVAADPTASATVVSAARYAGEAKSVAQLVATAPGVAVNEYGGLGHFSTVSIRGSNANGVLILLDGLPLNTEAGGGVDLSSIPRAWIERIEIVRGPEGAAYGAGALGGVVNVITRHTAAGHASGEAMTGSFGTYSLAAERPGFESGAVLLAASGESSRGDFPYLWDPDPAFAGDEIEYRRSHNATARGGVMAKGRFELGARRLDALVQLSAGRRELAGRPYGLNPGFPDDLTPNDLERDGRALATARLVTPGPLRGLLLAARAHARADVLNLTHGAVVARQLDVAGGAEAEALLDHRRGSARLALSATDERLSGDGFGEERGRASFAVAAADALQVAGELRVAPAFRLERVGQFSGWSAKLGASTPLTRWLTARASGGRTFRAPSLAELYLQQALVAPNPDLRSEVGLGADASLVAEGRGGFASIGAHVTRYDDLIVYRPATFGLRPFNSRQALVAGLEVEGATAPLSRLRASLQVAYTLLSTETLEGDVMTLGRELPRQPRHRLFARAAIAPGAFGAHVEAHFVSPQFSDDRNADLIPAATVWNAGASYRILSRQPVYLALEVKNALDDRTLLDPLKNPLPGRTVLVSIRLDATPYDERLTP